jgi:adenylosuccinate lyase
VIERYRRPEMARLWSEAEKLAVWLEVELAVVEALEQEGIAPAGTAARIRGKAVVDPGRAAALEGTLHHDVIAFLTSVSENLGDESRWLHYGMTSSDLLDTALGVRLGRAGALVDAGADLLQRAVREQALAHRETPMVGRTHGVHAEPTTFGLKLLGWYAELGRHRERLARALEGVAVGKISGAVGTFTHLPPRIEERVCARLGLGAAPVSTQILQRDRHADLLCVLANLSAGLEKFATEIRNLQRTEILEVEEPFGRGQKGSSSMPHKRNPITCERVAGLARVVRGYAVAALENVNLWHERDITHSSVERVIFPDAFLLVDYQMAQMTRVVAELIVYPDRMRANLERMGGLVFSQRLLLALVERGLRREEAYDIVQEHALAAWQGGPSFRDRVKGDARLAGPLGARGLDEIFDLSYNLRHVDAVFRRVLGEGFPEPGRASQPKGGP